MVGLTALFVFQQALLGADPGSYHAALADAQTERRPLLVLVGAQWCPGCQTMKQRVIPSLARRGALRTVSFATIDTDAEAELAQQLMRGGAIPQLIAFSRTRDGKWHREQITGTTDEAGVQSLIARAVKAQQAPAEPQPGSAIGN
jgi:thioredoxin-like negative regulator of GroEL